MHQDRMVIRENVNAGAVVPLFPTVHGPCVVRIGATDCWGTARMSVNRLRGNIETALNYHSKRIGPADYQVFYVAEGQEAGFDVAVADICTTVNHQAITLSGFAYSSSGARNPRVWAEVIPADASQQPISGMSVVVDAYNGADLAALPHTTNRDMWVYPTTGENRAFSLVFSQDSKLDLVGPDGGIIRQLMTGQQTYTGPLPVWCGIRIRNLAASTDATGVCYVHVGHMRYVV